jgi:hypothetical protein
MSKTLLAILVWLAMVGITIGVRYALAEDNNERQTSKDQLGILAHIDDISRLQLKHTPTKSSITSHIQEQRTAHAEFFEELQRIITVNNGEFVRCGIAARAKSIRPRDFLDISISVHSHADVLLVGSETKYAFRIEDVSIERSTIDVTAAEQTCIGDVFRSLRIAARSAPKEPILYPFCFATQSKANTQLTGDRQNE